MEDEALTRGAAMAFYTVTSLAPILLIVIAIAGLFFGRDAAQNTLSGQFQSLMGQQSAGMLQSIIQNANQKSSGILATIVGVVTLLITASGVFGEMQSALNTIWKAKPDGHDCFTADPGRKSRQPIGLVAGARISGSAISLRY